ncbi:hypothetical protein CF327_g6757 [Tilletia walkeri]|nr:hypothetical protein CF327_g6757 [Tilletia walkeri]
MFPGCYNQAWANRLAGIQIWVEFDGVDGRHEVTKRTSNLTGYQTVGLVTPCNQMVRILEALHFVRVLNEANATQSVEEVTKRAQDHVF